MATANGTLDSSSLQVKSNGKLRRFLTRPPLPVISGVSFALWPSGNGSVIAGDDGSIWVCVSRNGRGGFHEWRVLAQSVQSTTYRTVGLPVDGRRKTVHVHRIILESFVGPCPDGMESRHIDGSTANNTLTNLAWGTKQENVADKRRHGTIRRGGESHSAKLTESDAQFILDNPQISLIELGRRFGVTGDAVGAIRHRRTWKHLTGPNHVPK